MRKRRKRRSHYHTGVHVSAKCDEFKYRSGWEDKLATFMDNDPGVASYSYESVIIPYVSNAKTGKTRKYYPDFLVTHADGHRTLVEVKPSRKLSHRVVVKKLAAARVWCEENDAVLSVITEVELKQLGCL